MIRKYLCFLFIIMLLGCNKKEDAHKISPSDKKVKTTSVSASREKVSFNKKLIGVWTDGSLENATFQIKKNTILYVDQLEEYKYSVNGAQITIYYPDFTYEGNFSFKQDTLIMNSNEFGESKFWRFKG